jgi:hypothetical protein
MYTKWTAGKTVRLDTLKYEVFVLFIKKSCCSHMILVISVDHCLFCNVHLPYLTNFSPHSNGLIRNWTENEPSLSEENHCVVLIMHNLVDGGAEIHAKLDNCGKTVHNFVCITHQCLNQDMKSWGPDTSKQERRIQFPPRLEIR